MTSTCQHPIQHTPKRLTISPFSQSRGISDHFMQPRCALGLSSISFNRKEPPSVRRGSPLWKTQFKSNKNFPSDLESLSSRDLESLSWKLRAALLLCSFTAKSVIPKSPATRRLFKAKTHLLPPSVLKSPASASHSLTRSNQLFFILVSYLQHASTAFAKSAFASPHLCKH